MNRLLAHIRLDLTLQYRYGLYAVSLAMVLIWGVLLSLIVGAWALDRAVLVPAFLVVNLIITTFYFAGAMLLLEKDEGVLPLLATTPLRGAEYLLSKALTLALLALIESLSIVALIFGPGFNWGALVGGTLLLGAFYTLAGFIFMARYDSLSEYLIPSTGMVMMLLLPLLGHFDLIDERIFFAHPVAPALALLRAASGAGSGREIIYGMIGLTIWLAASFVWAHRRYYRYFLRAAA